MSGKVTITASGPFAGTVVNVKDHGATGDGSTDDTDHLRDAIAASREGDAVYFPAGTYLISKRLMPKAQQVYFSLTDAATIKVKAPMGSDPFPVFVVESGPVGFHHLTLDLLQSEPPKEGKEAPPGILARATDTGAVDVVVSSCRIRGGYGQGIRIGGSGDSGRDHVIIRDSLVEDCFESGLTLGRVNGARVEACRFERCRNGIQVASCRDVVISAVVAIDNRRHGIGFRFSHDWHVRNCVASGNGDKETDQEQLRGWGIAAGGGPELGTPNSDFTITDNICENNYAGGITLDPTLADDPAEVLAQRARVSGNVCRGRRDGPGLGGEDPFGIHGIHVRNSSEVVVTDNHCYHNHNSGIQIVNSRHVLVQSNACYGNANGIGLFSREDVEDPGRHVIGVNMLYDNDQDLKQGDIGEQPTSLPGVRLYGLHGTESPEGSLRANPGTLFEWHDDHDGKGALYVKEHGCGDTGWMEVATRLEHRESCLTPDRRSALGSVNVDTAGTDACGTRE